MASSPAAPIPAHERDYLRELARKHVEYAALPVMQQRRRMWYDLNDAKPGARPPVVLETWTFDRDFMPAGTLRCEHPDARGIERHLLYNIRNHEIIDDDKVFPDTFDIGWHVSINELGVNIHAESIPDAQGVNTGYQYIHPIKDIRTDLDLLKPAQCSVDRESTLKRKAFLEELLGDIIPVRIRSGTYGYLMLTQRVVALMGMEAFFLAMIDTPDEVHRLMAFLRDNALRVMDWAQNEGLLELNNENQTAFGSSYNFTTRLPPAGSPAAKGARPRLSDMWAAANSQETVGISTEMFHEFCFPYYRDACAPVGLLYYGCCEPTSPFWEDIRRLPHLKKVSISRWCDQAMMGKTLRGTDIVFSRKPDPNFLGVDVALNEEVWAKHIRESLQHTPGVFVEFIIRDVYTVHGNLQKGRRAVQIAREQIDRHHRG